MAFEFIKSLIRKVGSMFNGNMMRNISEIAESDNIASQRMMEAIELWIDMYQGNAPWLNKNPQSLGIPTLIAAEMARLVTIEMEVNVSGSPMADYLNEQLEQVRKDIRTNTEYACASGGIVFKPYICGDKITTEVIQANAFYPFAYDNNLKITGAYFLYRKWVGKEIYSRLEKHELKGTEYTITNRAFVSAYEEAIGRECQLIEIEEWADIQPEVNISNVESPLFSYFRIPLGNTIDLRSPIGVSVYSRSVDLIREADKQFQRLLWEYEGGELAIDASEDAFKRVGGIPQLPEGKERLFRTNNLDTATASGNGLFSTFSPTLRDQNYLNGLNKILVAVEDSCNVSRGTISNPDVEARTATELKILKDRKYATVKDIQMALQEALEDLISAMHTLAILYDLSPDGNYETTYVWDDSIIVDAEAERLRDQQEVNMGLMNKWEYRVKWYGEDEVTAKKMLSEMQGPTDDEILGFDKEETEEEIDDKEEPETEEEET